ncbi:type IV pili twitching motility protein PilT [Candidatus Kaiserbacteria bacterium RIFCSPLOWO2_02_FULL_45_11b]|uniref:Type IV pili twitching motility protein PilT n=1 Tax=Candidatus Kaiserbacteria bacterium RIFCSPLOWO2_12_FULL_45_26 TaxID=1798525 RepID=A0A1F6FG11_9BACT|nr:MAG: type IV pili twitching motility protein PilT [Candidatus Kaiserbacteria bacterium RIFCSPHIGHO2_12_45_16]OGG69872.1 MAG: type IV pili twitching motility protein PilT [Candidatus Kaiserbacteria bacterium RIFCSPLOWO2_01_FULL_45_25]OGG80786.1 MAG: type IV pili twitching motility protein PilT [Candidatus Kaiserbacteria bacterium RIFCSPLOWO2_02_FULL_45_11b]OGG84804.1 MAG: type IV pili twitching motility protein PilT [Candidatus Kaiserbacteria bacterium RIFCSPLOWO2_12_FULL_45_26]
MSVDYKRELQALIDLLVNEKASDMHFAVDSHPLIRVAGTLIPLVKKPILTEHDVAAFAKVMMRDDQFERLSTRQEVDFSFENTQSVRFRGNGFFQRGKMSIALRLIPNVIKTFEELNLPPILESFTQRPQGFFLCVGPVGQGKSTTLAAMVNHINRNRAEHIVTIEDPIEYVYQEEKSLIDQREVGIDTVSFQSALNAAFRQDVDVILVGEMRNAETIATAVTAAETGHLVYSTLHTNDAAQTINRIIDSFPGDQQAQIRVQLSSSLIAIFSQRLIPHISGGLVPAYELLINNTAVSNLIRENRVHEIPSIIEIGLDQGMIDMNRSLARLVQNGDITVENAFTYSTNPKGLERLI